MPTNKTTTVFEPRLLQITKLSLLLFVPFPNACKSLIFNCFIHHVVKTDIKVECYDMYFTLSFIKVFVYKQLHQSGPSEGLKIRVCQ